MLSIKYVSHAKGVCKSQNVFVYFPKFSSNFNFADLKSLAKPTHAFLIGKKSPSNSTNMVKIGISEFSGKHNFCPRTIVCSAVHK